MSDISQITLGGVTYNLKDEVARQQIQQLDANKASNAQLGEVESDISALQVQIQGLTGPVFVSSTSEMINHNLTYINTTDNNWYYYNTSTNQWTIGGAYGGVTVDATLEHSGQAADAKATGDEITAVKNSVNVINPNVLLRWELGKNIDGTPKIATNNYTALSSSVRCVTGDTIIRTAPSKDNDNNTLVMYIGLFAGEVCKYRKTIVANESYQIPAEVDSSKIDNFRIGFGRTSSSGVQISQNDIDTYYSAEIFRSSVAEGDLPDSYFIGRGNIPAGAESLSDFLDYGTYRITTDCYTTITDLPANFEKNWTTYMIVYDIDDDRKLQFLYEIQTGHLWYRSIATSTSTITSWYESHNSKSLYWAGADADTLSWNGWYGWGSTEVVANIPPNSVAGMLLNVVRTEDTKYQIAFDYTTTNIYFRSKKLGTWGNWRQLAYLDDVPNSKFMKIKYESGSFADGKSPERLHIYVPASTGYILYMAQHFIDNDNNCDCWQIYNAYQVDDSFDYANRKTLTVSGEWECAIHLDGRDDFSGGHTHGDEIIQGDAVFLIDGLPVDISDFTTLTSCKEVRIIRASKMYDPANHTTAIADHGVEYVFNSDGLTINQSLKWNVAESLKNCFMCMFLPSKHYIDRAVANTDFEVLTLPSETGQPLVTVTKNKSTAVTMWDTDMGVFANVSIPVYPTGLSGGDKMTIHDNSNKNYNKVYFYICTGGTSSVGELWKSKSVYKIDYKAPAI